MDLMLKISEEVQEQWAKVQQEQEQEEGKNSGEGVPFRSVYTINGNPILPPLMTPERRLEMQELRQAAMEIEKQLEDELKTSYKRKKNRRRWLNSDCRQLVDASTSTDSLMPKQPLTVIGRFKQQLQLSETLIYDNNLNAIIKFVKSDQKESKITQLVLEEWPAVKPQYAVIKEEFHKFGMLTMQEETELGLATETESKAEAMENIEPSTSIENTENSIETPPGEQAMEEDKAIKDLIGVARKLKENIVSTERELRRSSTSPFLTPKTEKDSALKDIVSSYCYVDRSERLHPTLWKRYHSYPFGSKPTDCAAPTSPNGGIEINTPTVAPPPTPVNASSSKIQIKQRMAPEDQQTKLKSKVFNGSQQKLIGNKLASNRKTPRASSSVSYAAHATSHAKVEGGSNEGTTRISSTQRRLSYDPRATLKRATVPKKAATGGSNSSQATVPAALPPGSSTDQLKRRLLDEMEQQQRQRFHQLVSQQADEQQRMQEEFRAQQQLLMDQMLCDMNTFPYEKYEEPDHPDSESSSVTSLPQSRLDLDINDEQKTGI